MADGPHLNLVKWNNAAAGLAVLAACTADVRQWYMQNGLQLNLDNSILSAQEKTDAMLVVRTMMS